MKKICEKCGKEFEAAKDYFKICWNCNKTQSKSSSPVSIQDLFISSFHDAKGNMVKDVFIDKPAKLAAIFINDRPSLASKQLRDFYNIILRARNKSILKGMDFVKPILWECQRNAEYQLKREVIPPSFSQFLEHYIKIAEANEQSLDGFCQLIQSIIAYYPKEKGAR